MAPKNLDQGQPNATDLAQRSVYGSFDARVHSEPTIEPDMTVMILLRRLDGQFIRAFLKPSSTDAVSYRSAQHLTTESLVFVSGSTVATHDHHHQLDNGDTAAPEVASFRVAKLTVRSRARAVLPEHPRLHGAPGEVLPPAGAAGGELLRERLDNRLLDARVAATAAIFKLSSGVHELAVEHLAARGFFHVPTPALVAYEFPGEEDDLFSVPYFGRTARLAPTGEVHLGMALSADLERVYDFHSVFRREPGSDGRHLTEFTMLELVFSLQRDWTEILDTASDLIVSLVQSLQKRDKYLELTRTAQRLYPSAGKFKLGLDQHGKLIRLTFKEAKEILRASLGQQSNDDDDEDFTREEEAALGRFLASDESHIGHPTDVFVVTHFPRHLRPCNIYPSEDGDNTSQSFDVILRGQEIITGCRLLHSHEELRSAFTTRVPPIDPDSAEWRPYVLAHEIGMPPWGGFGMGINRLVQGFWGLDDIRETVLFPRDATRLTP
ncbi:hypothetical protein B0T25DRAFT_587939 [Lasiosphaeria hispida]|uniref:Aminoacyl-transfer RNA synthetases class-II family profile domain-containing protein n=1 Tax=Lasiosphaeria hispida TaxID=260671 RepID=A0AAJ0HNZ3_9PEZI|nr:hypothetical protein B0T25DRAFT_587939 [Lasiosphaeria hispida]